MSKDVKAAVLERPREPLKISRFDLRSPERGAATVRVEMAGVCGTDVRLQHGNLSVPYPIILGHETVGRIEKLGSGLHEDALGMKIVPGDRVIFAASIPCERCYYCAIVGEPTKCIRRPVYGINLTSAEPPHLLGGYSEYIYLLPRSFIFRLPDKVPTEAVAAFGCAAPTVIHAFEVAGGISPGDTVLIQGAGPVGLFASVLARESGAGKVIVLDSIEKRLNKAESLGAETLNLKNKRKSDERIREVLEITGGYGADVVVECTGNPEAVQDGWLMCRDSGKYVEVGQYTDRGSVQLNPHLITRKQLKIYGSWGMAPKHYSKALKFIETRWKKYYFDKIISHIFRLD